MMFNSLLTMTLTLAAIGAGLMAGVYFAFSTFVMRSFDQLDAAQAINAMNAINQVIVRSLFLALFFGSTLLFAFLSAFALFNGNLAGRWLLFSTALIYVTGMFICTVAFNVPLNNRLAQLPEDASAKSEMWTIYFKQWTRWNHLRTVCSLVGLVGSMYYLILYA